MDYHLTIDGLIKFRDKIYVPDNSEVKILILKEFHANPYSGHLGYHKTFTSLKKFYYLTPYEYEPNTPSNLKKPYFH